MTWNIRQMFAKIATYKSIIITCLAIILMTIGVFIVFYPATKTIDDIPYIINYTTYSGSCSNCHNQQINNIGINKNRCAICHEDAHNSGDKGPSRYVDEGKHTVHSEHSSPNTNQKSCLICHAVPTCDKCHGIHTDIPDINKAKNCQNCHGGLPEPRGHKEQRYTFKNSMHGWMVKCDTCHEKDKLRFKNIRTYDINNASNASILCYICHSKQYKDENHPRGVTKEDMGICVNCHDPHNRPIKGNYIPNAEPINQTMGDVKKKIGDNAWLLIIIILFLSSVILEYIFRPQKGNIILSKTLRIEHKKSRIRAIRIKVKESDSTVLPTILCSVVEVLRKNNMELVGVSSDEDETVIFLSGRFGKGEERRDKQIKLISDIASIDGIFKAEYSREYEV